MDTEILNYITNASIISDFLSNHCPLEDIIDTRTGVLSHVKLIFAYVTTQFRRFQGTFLDELFEFTSISENEVNITKDFGCDLKSTDRILTGIYDTSV